MTGRNRLCLKRLETEVTRHHHVRNMPCSESESLPRQPNIPLEIFDLRSRRSSVSSISPSFDRPSALPGDERCRPTRPDPGASSAESSSDPGGPQVDVRNRLATSCTVIKTGHSLRSVVWCGCDVNGVCMAILRPEGRIAARAHSAEADGRKRCGGRARRRPGCSTIHRQRPRRSGRQPPSRSVVYPIVCPATIGTGGDAVTSAASPTR
jgi:hypothetical protein